MIILSKHVVRVFVKERKSIRTQKEQCGIVRLSQIGTERLGRDEFVARREKIEEWPAWRITDVDAPREKMGFIVRGRQGRVNERFCRCKTSPLLTIHAGKDLLTVAERFHNARSEAFAPHKAQSRDSLRRE